MGGQTRMRHAKNLLLLLLTLMLISMCYTKTITWREKFDFLLQNCPLSFLATSLGGHSELSLMFFTFFKNESLVLFSTARGGDRKFQYIMKNPNVAVLLHNFEGIAAETALLGSVPPVSATLYGTAAVASGEKAELYRKIQEEAHPRYAGAFQGKDKAILAISTTELLVVDVNGNTTRTKNPFGM